MIRLIKRLAAARRERRRVAAGLQYWVGTNEAGETQIGAFRHTPIILKTPEEVERFIEIVRAHSLSENVQ
jgi:hypothetical protein